MARAFSLLLLALWSASALSQTFGRFGYGTQATVPGWKLSRTGFRASPATADAFKFPQPVSAWTPLQTSAGAQTVDLGAAPKGAPSRLRMDLGVPGFALFFENGIDLALGSTGAPFLSWREGSVAQTVPTPPQPWILVSFRTSQPPVLLVFPDSTTPLAVEGEAGDWHIRSQGAFQGWVRVLLPLGEEESAPMTAAGLGELAAGVERNSALWSGPAPKLVDSKVTADETSITATWVYDKPGALVPQAALLAGIGGASLHITSEITQLESSNEEGPMAVTSEPKLAIRFLAKRWPEGRYLTLGEPPTGPASDTKVPEATVELAMRILCADSDSAMNSAAGSNLMAYLSSAHGDQEAATGQRLPYAASGAGYDLTAANALLTQALATANGTADLPNPLLGEVLDRIDAYSWQPSSMDETTARRAAALASLALAMRPEPEQRLVGAMLQAGLSASRGLDLWRHWRGDPNAMPQHLEPMENVRRVLYSLKGVQHEDPQTSMLLSPIRSATPTPLQVLMKSGKPFLSWLALTADPGSIELSSATALRFGGTENLRTFSVEQHGSECLIRFTPKDAGICGIEVQSPAASMIPARVEPRYEETSR